MSNFVRAITAFVTCAVTAACGDLIDPVDTKPGSQPRAPSFDLRRAAALQIQNAQLGRSQRGEQDEMLKLEARFPGFGGYFVDSLGDLVLYLRDSSRSRGAEVRAALDED